MAEKKTGRPPQKGGRKSPGKPSTSSKKPGGKPAGVSKKPQAKGVQKKHPPVVLFTGPGCQWCAVAKKHLKKHEIRFRVIDITKDKKAKEDCWKQGCRGIPVVLIGSSWICGFDQKKIDKLLGI